MQKIGSFLQTILTPLAVIILAGVVAYDHVSGDHSSDSRSVVNGKALGRSFAPIVATNLGDAWLAAADALEQGKSIPEAQAALQAAWQDARIKSFAAKIAPEFIKVLPEGHDPTNLALRADVVKLWRDFATGLKGGR
jgi:hypothetical protein